MEEDLLIGDVTKVKDVAHNICPALHHSVVDRTTIR